MSKFILIVLGVLAVAHAQRGGARVRPVNNELRQTTTPVPILRQINKVNEDGSYTYGYENADGSYKIETKTKEGEVQGKYGYYDDTGVLREIEYGASRQGFNPQGTDVRRPESAPKMEYDPFDDTGYYDPARYEKPFSYDADAFGTQPVRRPSAAGRRPGGRRLKNQFAGFATAPAPAPQPAPVQTPVQHHVVNHNLAPAPATPAPAPVHHQHQQYYQPQAPQVPHFNPAQLFHGHPARNIDINTGSYSVQYSG